jgi:hypothetical protein
VLDESHYIKNKDSARFKLLEPILGRARRLIMLSGTPALAKPVELYSQAGKHLESVTSVLHHRPHCGHDHRDPSSPSSPTTYSSCWGRS